MSVISTPVEAAVDVALIGDGHTVYRFGAPSCILDPVTTYLLTTTASKQATCAS